MYQFDFAICILSDMRIATIHLVVVQAITNEASVKRKVAKFVRKCKTLPIWVFTGSGADFISAVFAGDFT